MRRPYFILITLFFHLVLGSYLKPQGFKENLTVLSRHFKKLFTGVYDKKNRDILKPMLLNSSVTMECVHYNSVVTELGLSLSDRVPSDVPYTKFRELCPYIIYNALMGNCSDTREDDSIDLPLIVRSPWKVWCASLISVSLISLCSINGVLLHPLLKKKFFQKLLLFLLAFATGVLYSNGILQLMPTALGFDPAIDNSYLQTLVSVVFGIYTFILIELLLKTYISWKRGIVVPNLGEGCCSKQVLFDKHMGLSNNETSGKYLRAIRIVDGEPSSNDTQVHIAPLTSSSSSSTARQKSNRFYHPVCLNPDIPSTALLIIIGDILHNFVDGLAIGSSYAESFGSGFSISLAVFSEEFPHELGDFAVLVSSGLTISQSVFWNFTASLSCFIGCFIGISVGHCHDISRFFDAICAGMFIYISIGGMLPEIFDKIVTESEGTKHGYVTNLILCLGGILIGILLMVLMSYTSHRMGLPV